MIVCQHDEDDKQFTIVLETELEMESLLYSKIQEFGEKYLYQVINEGVYFMEDSE